MSDLSDNLRVLRTSRDMLQQDVSDKTGLTRSMVSGHENGRVPDANMLIKYAQLYDVSVDYLLGLTPQRKPGDSGELMRALDALAYAAKDAPAVLTAGTLTELCKRLRLYYAHGAPVGDIPMQLLLSYLSAYTALVASVDDHDDANVLLAADNMTQSLIQINSLMRAYYATHPSTPNI